MAEHRQPLSVSKYHDAHYQKHSDEESIGDATPETKTENALSKAAKSDRFLFFSTATERNLNLNKIDYSSWQRFGSAFGVVNGLIFSSQSYLLGSSFGKHITQGAHSEFLSGISSQVFGIGSFIPNSCPNVLITQEVFAEIFAPTNKSQVADRLQKDCLSNLIFLGKCLIFVNSTITAIVILSITLAEIESASLSVKFFLGVPTFISNLAIYYSSKCLLIKQSAAIIKRCYQPELNALSAKLDKQISRISLTIIDLEQETFEQIQELELSMQWPSVAQLANKNNSEPKSPSYKRNILGGIGVIVGILGIIIYSFIGKLAAKESCNIMDSLSDALSCSPNQLQSLETIFGISALISFSMFASVQTKMGLEFFYDKITHHKIEFSDRIGLTNTQKNISLVLFTMFSVVPNCYLAYKIYEEFTFTNSILMTTSTLSPAIINAHWFTEMISKLTLIFYNSSVIQGVTSKVKNFFSRCKNRILGQTHPYEEIPNQTGILMQMNKTKSTTLQILNTLTDNLPYYSRAQLECVEALLNVETDNDAMPFQSPNLSDLPETLDGDGSVLAMGL